jgi:uncharacterized protein YecE (DUF72 family)
MKVKHPTSNVELKMDKLQIDNCRIRVGTSGYSYAEWVDAGVYPPGTRSADMLPLYARRFSATELNYTWYQMPRAPAIDRMRQKVPVDFGFAAKLTRTMTHEIKSGQWRGEAARYRNGVAPLVQTGQLLAVLMQFPPTFDRSRHNRMYLASLLDALAGLPLAVEFRNVSWAADRVFKALEDRHATLVTVDEPDLPGLFPPLTVVTNPDLFYIRFHGRNTRGWRSGNMQKQFDYDYTDNELTKWVDQRVVKMAGQAKNGVIFFNNHVRGQAVGNAARLVEMVGS